MVRSLSYNRAHQDVAYSLVAEAGIMDYNGGNRAEVRSLTGGRDV